jgi:hypothetical protein
MISKTGKISFGLDINDTHYIEIALKIKPKSKPYLL